MDNDKLTIKDIAELAQVSKGTVSKALNDQPGVGKETKERILKLVKQLDFHPNSAAQALASSKTENLGLFMPHIPHNTISNSYWSAIISGIVESSNKMGFNILLFTIEEGKDLFEAYNLLLKRKRVDGFIVGSELLDNRSINSLYSSNIPFVLLGQSRLLKHYNVDVDNYSGAFNMVSYMIKQGYKRVAFLSGTEELTYMNARIKGYQDAIDNAGLDFKFYTRSEFNEDSTKKALDLILEQKPDGLLVGAGGEFLFHTLDKLNEMNIKMPDFGLSSFDDYIFMNYLNPKITAISQPFKELGASAVEMLCEIIEKGTPSSEQIIHHTFIVPRESCGEKM